MRLAAHSDELRVMTMRKRFEALLSSRFLRSVGVLVGGAALAQAILAAALPVLTRLYTPADFAVLAVFGGALSIVSVAACLRFDVAVPIPESDEDAINIVGLAAISTLLVSVALACCVFAAPATITDWFDQPALESYLWLLPFGVFLAGCHAALQFWFVRKKQFPAIASARVGQSVACAGAQLGLGWMGAAPFGLIIGQVLNSGAGCMSLGYRLLTSNQRLLRVVSWRRMRELFHAYSRFPKYSTLEAVSNAAGMHVPIMAIAALASGPEAGYLALALYTIQAPMGLIGGATAQVYLSRAPDEYRAGRLSVFTASVFGGLLKSGVGVLIFAGIVAPELFAIVFGEEWTRAGVLVAWMTPWFVMQFLSAPVSMALHVTNHQRAALILQVFGLVTRVAFVYAAALLWQNYLSEAYALSGLFFYLAYLAAVLRAVSCRLVDLWIQLKGAVTVIFLWALAGLVTSKILSAVKLWVASAV